MTVIFALSASLSNSRRCRRAMGDVQAVTTQIGDVERQFGNVKNARRLGRDAGARHVDDILRRRRARDELGSRGRTATTSWNSRSSCRCAAQWRRGFRYRREIPGGGLRAHPGSRRDRRPRGRARSATRGLERRVRDEAKKLAGKYICPPATVEFEVMYLPTDGLYAEIARASRADRELGRQHRVLVMGPSLFPALLRTIHLGHITLSLEQKADEIGKLRRRRGRGCRIPRRVRRRCRRGRCRPAW